MYEDLGTIGTEVDTYARTLHPELPYRVGQMFFTPFREPAVSAIQLFPALTKDTEIAAVKPV
ncbi:MAG: hypothetical protein DHS20C16_35600 [Phycisphaerae bacterium]|nr:MAG: hypothetical protein DHS20C16_35600 [Phycisphaerae bacterium]